MGTILVTEHLTRRFGGVVAVNDVSLTVEAGERHAIIGPNGAGKTTLFNLISGELPPSSGRVLLGSRPITDLAPHLIARQGLTRTFQRSNLLQNLTALENVRLAVQAHTTATRRFLTPTGRVRHLHDTALAFLARLGLEDRAALPARALSYGEQRQLELAIALGESPASSSSTNRPRGCPRPRRQA